MFQGFHPQTTLGLGGKSDNILRLVAEEGNGWDIDIHENVLNSIKERVVSLRKYCLTIKRNPNEIDISTHSIIILAKTNEKAIKLASLYARAINKNIEEFIADYFIGSPEHIVKKIKSYINIGVTNLCFSFINSVEDIEVFGEEVIPALINK